MSRVLCKKFLFFDDLFQILHTSITIKNGESVVKSE